MFLQKKPKMGSSNFNVDILGDDIWETIFLLLPIRSLFTLKCVSKAWNALISKAEAAGRVAIESGYFYQDVCCSAKEWKCGSLSNNGGGDLNLDLEFLPCFGHPSFQIEQSRNGLLLCSRRQQYSRDCPRCNDLSADCVTETISYFVCNPLTRTWVQLPERQLVVGCFDRFSFPDPRVVLLCDPQTTAHFKIIRLLGDRFLDKEQMQFDIYSSETGQWDTVTFTALGDRPADVFLVNDQYPVYLKGVVYALAGNHEDKQVSIVALDVEARKFHFIKLGKIALHYYLAAVEFFIKEFNGELHFVRNCLSEILVYKMEDQWSSTWVLLRKITVDDLVKQHSLCNASFVKWSFLLSSMSVDFDVLFLVGAHQAIEEQDIFQDVDGLVAEGGNLFSYHLQSNRLEKVNDIMRDDHLLLNYTTSTSYSSLFFQFTPCLLNLLQRQPKTTLTL